MNVSSNDLVLRVIAELERQNIPHMLVGSFSSNAYGIVRSTQDADFVVELGDRSILPLAEALAPEIRLDPQLAFESITMTSRFVARHPATGFKIEFFLLTDESFDRERFQRRRQYPFLNREAWLPTPEDVILQKLRWFQRSRRAKDLDDARNVTAVVFLSLDLDYIRKWCDRHETRELFEHLLTEAKEFEEDAP